jgi:hypothetical protein
MRKVVPIKSDFAILDVKAGRDELTKHFADRPRLGPCPEPMRIPVTIMGYIDSVHSDDDGTSREFSIVVTSVKAVR